MGAQCAAELLYILDGGGKVFEKVFIQEDDWFLSYITFYNCIIDDIFFFDMEVAGKFIERFWMILKL